MVKGMPFIWINGGHDPRRCVPSPETLKRAHATFKERQLIPRDRVRPLAQWLLAQYGSTRRAAEMIGMPVGTFRDVLYRGESHPWVLKDTAKLIVDAVPRVPKRPASMFDEWELPYTRYPTFAERLAAKRESEAKERKFYRDKAKRNQAS